MRYVIVTTLLAAGLLAGCSAGERAELKKDASKTLKTAGKTVDNGMDTAKVKSALMASSQLDASRINVDKEKNVFYLRGAVTDAEQKQRAVRLTKDMIASTDQVVDELEVSPAADGTATVK